MASQTAHLPGSLFGRDFLTMNDFSGDEIIAILDFASFLKRQKKEGASHKLLEGKNIALYFEKPSNRTRVSFEVGIYDLGANAILLRKEDINLGVRESIEDTARTLSRYVDAMMIRTFVHSDVEQLAKYATMPIINGLTDDHHPCQVLADLLTFKETFGDFKGKKLAYIGDGNNMCHSLMTGCAKVGLNMTVATPKGYEPHHDIVNLAQEIARETGAVITVGHSIEDAARDAHAVYTDVWASMGAEREIDTRRDKFAHYQVNEKLMATAQPNAIVLHCLPAHLGEEIEAATFEKHEKSIFEQAENRLHAQKSLMVGLMKQPG